jgi:hypothetical protein
VTALLIPSYRCESAQTIKKKIVALGMRGIAVPSV